MVGAVGIWRDAVRIALRLHSTQSQVSSGHAIMTMQPL